MPPSSSAWTKTPGELYTVPLPTTPADKKFVVGAGVRPTTTGAELFGEGVARTTAGASEGVDPIGARVGDCVGTKGAGVGKGIGPIGPAEPRKGARVLGIGVDDGAKEVGAGVKVGDGVGPAPARVGAGVGLVGAGVDEETGPDVVKTGEGVEPVGAATGETVGGGVPVRWGKTAKASPAVPEP